MRWMALSALLLLAGCLDGGPGSRAAADGAEQERTSRLSGDVDGDGVRAFDASFDLVLNPDHEVLLFTMVAGDRNCIDFSGGGDVGYQIHGGTATMTWDALTPLAEELVLTAYGSTEPLQGSGPSPLTLDLTGFAWHPDARGISFMADHEVPHLP